MRRGLTAMRHGVAIVCGTSLWLLGLCVSAEPFPRVQGAQTIQPGVFLIADPSLTDPNFRQTVVLLWSHEKHGTHGVIINRPTKTALSQALPNVSALQGMNLMLYLGGPVALEQPIFLLRHSDDLQKGKRILPDVFVSTNVNVLQPLLGNRAIEEVLRIYSGHARWAPGQLASEMAKGAWHVVRGDAPSIFNPDPADIWSRLFTASQAIKVYHKLTLPALECSRFAKPCATS